MGAHPWGLSLLPLDVSCLFKKKQMWKLRHMALTSLSHCFWLQWIGIEGSMCQRN